jgi:hypothetical protein
MLPNVPSRPVRLAAAVSLSRQDDITRILALDRGRFYGLDAIASRLLDLTLQHGPDHAAAQVAGECGAEPALVRADLEVLLARLDRRGLLQRPECESASAGRWLPRWLAGPCRVRGPVTTRLASRLLRRAWWSLRLDGWASTLRRWRRPVGPARPVTPGEAPAVIEAVDRAVRDAAAGRLLFAAACKERALVGYHLVRAVFGLPAVLVLGVQHYPFGLHAWVEAGERTVTDDEDFCANFTPAAQFE